MFLLVAGGVLAAIVGWRRRQLDQWRLDPRQTTASARRFAPHFELNDQHSELVKFQRYLGRTRLVLVFFDGELGADHDSVLRPLIDQAEAIEAAGIQLVGVSLATPYANRQAEKRLGREVGFPLLTDVDLQSPITAPTHRLYGLFDEQRQSTRTGLFLIDRNQMVAMDPVDGFPAPVADPQAAITQLIHGEWPSGTASVSLAE
ncbi:MAG: redoxin domain-containing protein [Planctomycetaceae bacterium]|nr:redoxin domain-containing protein [Planctomycetaceae bacterium]